MARSEGTRKLVVLGLPWEATESTVESHFSQYGDIESAEVIHDRVTGKSRGFGFVTFPDSLAAEHALSESHTINGRRCDVKAAVPKVKGDPNATKTRRIFIARIPPTVTEDQFREYFESFGVVEDAYMPKDHTRQSYRGIGFVTFADAGSTERVMAVKHRFDDHEVIVDRATPKDLAAGSPCQPGRYYFGNLPGQASQDANGPLHGIRSRSSRSDLGMAVNGFGNSPLSNLSSSQMDLLQGLRAHQFQDIGIAQCTSESVVDVEDTAGDVSSPTSIMLPPGLNSQLGLQHQEMGLAPLSSTMMDPLSQGLAIDVANRLRDLTTGGMETVTDTMVNCTLTNTLLTRASLQPSPKSLVGLQSVIGGDIPSPGRRMESPHVSSARGGPRLFVGKLSKDTTEQDLREYFMRYGYVMDVYMPRSKDNKKEHRGFGFVTFETEAAIQRVVAHGAHKLKGAVIAIDVAVPEEPPVPHLGLESRRSSGLSDQLVGRSISMDADCGSGSSRTSMHAMHTFQPF